MSANRLSRLEWLDLIEQTESIWEEFVAAVGDRSDEPGPLGEWSFKDLTQHLNGWRIRTVDRLEAVAADTDPPPFPWPASLDPDDVDAINDWFQEQGKARTYDELLAEARDQFARMRSAVEAIPEDVLNEVDRFPWMKGYAIGDVILGSYEHLRDEHETDIRAWLARN